MRRSDFGTHCNLFLCYPIVAKNSYLRLQVAGVLVIAAVHTQGYAPPLGLMIVRQERPRVLAVGPVCCALKFDFDPLAQMAAALRQELLRGIIYRSVAIRGLGVYSEY